MEEIQRRIDALRISDIELKLWELSREIRSRSFQLKRAKPDYYERTLEERRAFLGAASTYHLCKTIVLENTAYDEKYSNEPFFLKHLAVVIQYESRLNSEKVMKFAKNLQNEKYAKTKLGKKYFHFRLADEDEARELTGYGYNAITPFLMKTQYLLIRLPVIMSDALVDLRPNYLWLGGGEVDLKLGMSVDEFLKYTGAYVADIIYKE